MRVYIAGPMRGFHLYNFPAFDAAAHLLRVRGFEPVSPADLDRAEGFDPRSLPDDHEWDHHPEGMCIKEILGRDLAALATCDGIYLLDGWQESEGAQLERAAAKAMGIRVIGLGL